MLTGRVSKVKRKPSFINLSDIKSIGIAWNASRTQDFAVLSRFCQKMHERNIEVTVLGYFQGKNLPDQYTAIRFLTCFKKNELDFFYRPVRNDVNSFIRNRFDVLITINFENLFPLVYVSALSEAILKIGLFGTEPENLPYDLMMELKNSVNVEDYLNQILYYLGMINSEPVKTAV
jgi:hypothetical protein